MRFGIWTPLPHTIRPEKTMIEAVEQARQSGSPPYEDKAFAMAKAIIAEAERLGFEMTLIAQRYRGLDLDAWMLASALAAVTKKIHFMIAVHPGLIPPETAAKMGASIDRISGGRFCLNVVNGWYQKEFEDFSGRWLDKSDARYRRTKEFIEVLRGVWENDSFDFKGEYYTADQASVPLKPAQTFPHIYAASMSTQGKEIIAALCDACFITHGGELSPRDSFEEKFTAVQREMESLNAMSKRSNRTLRFGGSAHVILEVSEEKALQIADDLVAYGLKERYNRSVATSLGFGLVGTPEMVKERLHRYQELGIDFWMLHFHPMSDGMLKFANEIMPDFLTHNDSMEDQTA